MSILNRLFGFNPISEAEKIEAICARTTLPCENLRAVAVSIRNARLAHPRVIADAVNFATRLDAEIAAKAASKHPFDTPQYFGEDGDDLVIRGDISAVEAAQRMVKFESQCTGETVRIRPENLAARYCYLAYDEAEGEECWHLYKAGGIPPHPVIAPVWLCYEIDREFISRISQRLKKFELDLLIHCNEKRTPGDWVWADERGFDAKKTVIYEGSVYTDYEGAGGDTGLLLTVPTVGAVSDQEEWRAEMRANLRLAASAPQLLAEVIALKSYVERLKKDIEKVSSEKALS
jgi:hypothetical protein